MATDTTDTEKAVTNVQAFITGSILGTNVSGGYLKTDDKNSTVMLYGKAGDNSGMTLDNLIKKLGDAGEGFGFPNVGTSFTEKLPSGILDQLKATKVILANVYYFTEKVTGEDDKSVNKNTQYAISVKVEMSDVIKKGFPVDIDSLSLKIWSSNVPKKVQDEMKITEMLELMNSARGITQEND